MNDDELNNVALSYALHADERALAVHEAGHAAVAHGLGADVLSVEINLRTGGGETVTRRQFADQVSHMATLVAGYKAELAFAADELKSSEMLASHAVRSGRDYQQMQEVLLRLSEAGQRLQVLVQGFKLADVSLEENAHVLHNIADELFARRSFSADGTVRIEGEDLAALLAAVNS